MGLTPYRPIGTKLPFFLSLPKWNSWNKLIVCDDNWGNHWFPASMILLALLHWNAARLQHSQWASAASCNYCFLSSRVGPGQAHWDHPVDELIVTLSKDDSWKFVAPRLGGKNGVKCDVKDKPVFCIESLMHFISECYMYFVHFVAWHSANSPVSFY